MTWPNLISFFRILLAPLISFYLFTDQAFLAFYTFIIAGISDAVDGFIARVFKKKSLLGTYLDPLADKILIIFVFLTLYSLGHVDSVLVSLVIGRDFLIVLCTFFVLRYYRYSAYLGPLLISKINTFLQMLFIATYLYDLATGSVSPHYKTIFLLSVYLSTILSGLSYIFLGIKLLMGSQRRHT